MQPISYARHRFPPDVIRHAVWLYVRFTLSYRDVEGLVAERGLEGSNETIRRRVLKFGPAFAHNLRRGRPHTISGVSMRWSSRSQAGACTCGELRVSIASLLMQPSPNGRRVGIRIVTFEACSGFTHVTARRIAQPAQGDLCHEAPALPVTRTSRLSATRSIDNSLAGFFLHR